MKNEKNVIYKGNILKEYIINQDGIVKNIKTNNVCKQFDGISRNKKYVYVSLKINSKFISIPLHRILAETFIPNPNNYKYVLFKDSNYKNVSIDNLIWSNHTSIDYDEKRKKQNVQNVQKRRQKIKDMAIEYKGGECLICGYNRCLSALEFHHTDPRQKDFGISKDGYTMAWEKVKSELDKCICVCANCHREIHSGMIDIDKYLFND